jgi:hypothetical protein
VPGSRRSGRDVALIEFYPIIKIPFSFATDQWRDDPSSQSRKPITAINSQPAMKPAPPSGVRMVKL